VGRIPSRPIEPYATKFYSQALDEHTALVEAIGRAVISRGAGETVS